MTTLQETVDELRFILQREVIEDRPELWTLVRRYSDLCHEANVRLRKCETCLKQGLRSEAIQLAEETPNLMDLVATLDFAERAQLIDVADMYFQEPPEPLLLDVAASLNEAYALQEPLQKLLDRHRLLALSRRPMKERVAVLRDLAMLDGSTPHWADDVVEMEQARQGEMDAESRAAVATGDIAALKALADEAQNTAWSVEFPAGLLRTLKSRTAQTGRKQAQIRVEELNAELHAAFSALDVELARRLRDEWRRSQRVAQLADDDPLVVDVAPIISWLDDEDHKTAEDETYAQRIHAIEQALENPDATADELARLGFQVEQLNRAVPEALDRRFRHRLQTLRSGESRRRNLIYAAGAALFFAAVGVFGIAVQSSREADKTRRLVAAMDDLISDGKLQEARRLVEANAANTAKAWLAAQKKLAGAEDEEHTRTVKLNAELEVIHSLAGASQVEAALQKARELARTEEEKIELGKWERTWKKRLAEEVAQRETAFRQLLAAVSEAVQAFDRVASDKEGPDLDRLRSLLADATVHRDRLVEAKRGVAPELVTQASLLESRLKASRQLVDDLGRKTDLLEKLTRSANLAKDNWIPTEADAFAATLREFAAAFPNDPRSAGFLAAAETCPLKAVYAEQALLRSWKRLLPAKEDELDGRIKELRAFAAEHPLAPDLERLRTYENWLASVQRRYSDDGDVDQGARKRLDRLFNSKFIRDGNIFRDKEGRTYYLQNEKQVEKNVSKVGFKYFIGFNNELSKDPESKRPDELTSSKTESPPQAELAKKVRLTWQRAGLEGWNEYFRELSPSILKADQVDPFLRYLLLLKTLEFAALGDSFLEQELEPILSRLNDDKVDRSVAWMDPKNENAKKAREQAKELLSFVSPLELDKCFERADDRTNQFGRELFVAQFAVGWLEKTRSGGWRCRTAWTPHAPHELFVSPRPAADGKRVWQPLGRISKADVTIDGTAAQAAGEAGVVFARPASSEKKTAQSR